MHLPTDDQLRDIRSHLLARSAELGNESGDAEVARISRALERLEAGTYGTCETCGEKIETEHLRAVPYADVCRRCSPDG